MANTPELSIEGFMSFGQKTSGQLNKVMYLRSVSFGQKTFDQHTRIIYRRFYVIWPKNNCPTHQSYLFKLLVIWSKKLDKTTELSIEGSVSFGQKQNHPT